MIHRESFVFYESFYDAINSLPTKEHQADAYKAIAEYALHGTEPEPGDMGHTMWLAFRKQIDKNQRRYENSLKGGRKKKETKAEPKENQTETKVDENETDSEAKPETPKKKDKPTKHKYGEYKNVLLTDEEYAKLSKECDVDQMIEQLSSYMESHGKKYRNHYATIRNWIRRDRESPQKVITQNKAAEELDEFYRMTAEWAIEREGGDSNEF